LPPFVKTGGNLNGLPTDFGSAETFDDPVRMPIGFATAINAPPPMAFLSMSLLFIADKRLSDSNST
jgi:hypothetical protein